MSKMHICKYCGSVLAKVTDSQESTFHPWYCLVCHGYPDESEVLEYEFANDQQDIYREKLKQHLQILKNIRNDFTRSPITALLEGAPVGTIIKIDYVDRDSDGSPFTGWNTIKKLDTQLWEFLNNRETVFDGKRGNHHMAALVLDTVCGGMQKLIVKFP